MTEDELDQARYGCSKQQHRARLMFCMDYLMHNINDEEAIAPWLQDGPPDGLYQASQEPPSEEYEELDLSDKEFERMVGMFIKILAGEGGLLYGDRIPADEEAGKAVLA